MKLQQKSLFLSFCSWLVSVSHLVLSKLLCLQHLLSSVNFVYGQNQLHLKKNILASPRSFYKNLLLCKFHSRLFVFRRQQSFFLLHCPYKHFCVAYGLGFWASIDQMCFLLCMFHCKWRLFFLTIYAEASVRFFHIMHFFRGNSYCVGGYHSINIIFLFYMVINAARRVLREVLLGIFHAHMCLLVENTRL